MSHTLYAEPVKYAVVCDHCMVHTQMMERENAVIMWNELYGRQANAAMSDGANNL